MKLYKDGEPCPHAGCLHHMSHPCEGCGRVGGISTGSAKQAVIEMYVDYVNNFLTVEEFARSMRVTTYDALRIITVGKHFREEAINEIKNITKKQ